MERRRRWRGDRGDEVARQTLTRTQMSLVAGPTLENCSNDRIFYGISIETERGNITFSQPISRFTILDRFTSLYNFQHSFNASFLSPFSVTFLFPLFFFFSLSSKENEVKARTETLSGYFVVFFLYISLFLSLFTRR